MAFIKKNWVDRQSEKPSQRKLINEDGITNSVTVLRDEGIVFKEGDRFDSNNMNDLETRIESALDNVASVDTVDYLENRIENIVANSSSTDGNSELKDIRTSASGKIYTSAGASIRALGQGEAIIPGAIDEEKTSFAIKYGQFIKSSSWYNKQYWYANGGNIALSAEQSNGDRSAHKPIYLHKGITYIISNVSGFFTFLCENSGKIIKKLTDADRIYSKSFIPEKDCWIYITSGKSSDITSLDKVTLTNFLEKYGWGSEIYEDGYIRFPDSWIEQNMKKLYQKIVYSKPTKQLINSEDIVMGSYISYTDGCLVTNVGFYATGFIPVSKNKSYSINLPQGQGQQGAFFDKNKNYINGFTNITEINSNNKLIPDNATYIRFSLRQNQKDRAMFSESKTPLEFDTYGGSIAPTKIYVSKDGSADYINLVDAVNSIVDSAQNNPYEILIKEGTYDIIQELGGKSYLSTITSSADRAGLQLPDYVHLTGLGNVILKGEVSSEDSNIDTSTMISTLNTWKNNILKNLTITAKNLRYALHDESNNLFPNATREFINCNFIHEGNDDNLWKWTNAYAGGTSSNTTLIFKKCNFKAFLPFSTHDNKNQNASHITFEDCSFTPINEIYAMRFGTYSTNSEVNDVSLSNCQINGVIRLFPESGSEENCRWKLTGGGNTLQMHHSYTAIKNNPLWPKFSDEVMLLYNNSGKDIESGIPVIQNEVNNIIPIEKSSTKGYLFCGFTMENIPNNSWGYIKTKGFLHKSQFNTTFSEGELIGANGQANVSPFFAVATSNDYIKIIGYHV